MVDNTIATQIRPFQAPDIGQLYGNIQNIQMNRMRMAEAQEMAQERNALRSLMQGGVDVNTPEGLNRLRAAAPTLAGQIEQRAVQAEQARAQTRRYGVQADAARVDMFRNELGGVNSQDQWSAWRNRVLQEFPQYATSIPERFSPEARVQVAGGAAEIVRRATAASERAPDEFTRLLAHAGYAPGSPEAQALARGVLERRGMPPTTTVNMPPQMGQIPPGFRAVYDDQNRVVALEPIPGSPAAQEAGRREEAGRVRTEATQQTGGTVIRAIDRANEIMRTSVLPTTGFFAETLAGRGGTGARDLRGNLDTIRANIGFDQLNQMRQASPTGGALGNVSNQEIAYLQAVMGSVDQSQSAGELQRNLRRLREAYDEIVNYGLGNRPPVQIPGPGGRGTAEPPPREGVPDARRPAAGAAPAVPGEIRTPSGFTIRPIE